MIGSTQNGEAVCYVFQTEKTNDNHYTLLIDDLQKTAQELRDAYHNLGNAVDPDLIDCYIYELNSVQMRYKFLLTSLKKYTAEDSLCKESPRCIEVLTGFYSSSRP